MLYVCVYACMYEEREREWEREREREREMTDYIDLLVLLFGGCKLFFLNFNNAYFEIDDGSQGFM